MKKLLFFIVFGLLLSAETVLAAEIGGVVLPETLKAGETELKLNGYGLRTKFGFKVYAVGLYIKDKSADNAKLINTDEPMILYMHYRRTAPQKKVRAVYYDSFASVLKIPEQDNYDESTDYGPQKEQILDFIKAVTKYKIMKNDIYTFIYLPGKGTELYVSNKDGKSLIQTIPGLDFKKALFAIWLVDGAPVGKKLQKKLLGK